VGIRALLRLHLWGAHQADDVLALRLLYRSARFTGPRGHRLDPVTTAASSSATAWYEEGSGDPAGRGVGGAAPAQDLEQVASTLDAVVANVGKVLYGKSEVVRLAVACLVAGGHLLVEDLPGVGKTTLAKALARSLGLEFRRVQFTADLLPSDVTGAMIFDRERAQPVFRPGPVFSNVLLADELNRASPKAQSALLESMEERQVSMDGESFPLPSPFMVIATQNPFDAAGTYLLPHSQRDRFLLRVSIGYPKRTEEDALLETGDSRAAVDTLPAVTDVQGLRRATAAADRLYVDPAVRAYVLDLIEASRVHPDLQFGASPRAALALMRAAAAIAVTIGRPYVNPGDVQTAAEPVLAHRLVVDAAASLGGVDARAVVDQILRSVPVPVRPGART
jgi:MoxR-like ATPase